MSNGVNETEYSSIHLIAAATNKLNMLEILVY